MQERSTIQNLQRRATYANTAPQALKAIPLNHREFRKLPPFVQTLADAFDDAYERRDDQEIKKLKTELAKEGYTPNLG